jgi:hypothetical protein
MKLDEGAYHARVYTECLRMNYANACERIEKSKLIRKILYYFAIFAIIMEKLIKRD